MITDIPCALCGTTNTDRVIGRTGCACTVCLGEAVKRTISGEGRRDPPTVTASDRCLLCGEPIVSGKVVAVRRPYRLCGGCLVAALEWAIGHEEKQMRQFDF